MPNINLNYKMVTDIKNNFFTNNRFIAAESLPAEGDFVKGDLIVNIGENANDEAMWLCIESGNPGVWEVVGAGAGGGSSKIVTLKSRVVVNEALSEVNIGISGFNKATDTLIVFNNARFMVEGVDYEINADSTKIVAMNGNIWNEELANDYVFDFVAFKMMNVNENGEVVVSSANEIVKLKNTVVVNEAVNEVEIGIDGFNKGDDLTVYRNSVYMIEGIDYEVQGNKIVSLKGTWNAEGGSDYKFTFEVLKAVAKVNPDAVIGMDHLTEDVKEAIEAAGNIDLSGKQDKSDNGLVTTDKTIVGAINELFQNANNGKQLIASAIGEPLSSEDTFSAMSTDINGLLSTFKTNMMNNGVTVESSDKFKSLIDKINDVSNIKKQDIVDILIEKGVDANNTETWEEILSKLEVLKNPVPTLSYNTWTESPNMTVARYNPAAVAHENDIYVIGGYNTVESIANEKYDTLTGTWTTKTNAPDGLGYAAGANIGNMIYCFSYKQIYAYDTTSNTWSTKAKINATYGIGGCKMFNYNDNIYIYGEQYDYGNAMYKYDPVKNTVTQIKPEYQYMYEKNPLGFVLINGYIYAPGGYYIDDDHYAQNASVIYTISPETAEYGYASAGLGSYCHYESLVGFGINEKAYFCGGFYCSDYSDTDEPSLKVWCLDTYQSTVTDVADLPYFVYDSGSTSLNGVGYLIGGRTDYSTCSNKMIIYKP